MLRLSGEHKILHGRACCWPGAGLMGCTSSMPKLAAAWRGLKVFSMSSSRVSLLWASVMDEGACMRAYLLVLVVYFSASLPAS